MLRTKAEVAVWPSFLMALVLTSHCSHLSRVVVCKQPVNESVFESPSNSKNELFFLSRPTFSWKQVQLWESLFYQDFPNHQFVEYLHLLSKNLGGSVQDTYKSVALASAPTGLSRLCMWIMEPGLDPSDVGVVGTGILTA